MEGPEETRDVERDLPPIQGWVPLVDGASRIEAQVDDMVTRYGRGADRQLDLFGLAGKDLVSVRSCNARGHLRPRPREYDGARSKPGPGVPGVGERDGAASGGGFPTSFPASPTADVFVTGTGLTIDPSTPANLYCVASGADR